ncbi:TetR/AcrR family transcriptional regulator [Halovulum dunhuangense]|uniref:TetR/AcrR family transcriptional regulator n=1 Tax=Halovulum dunhuangense TaxID=1505036 RepID=A0A849L3I1_9RHOB|nr:TetR/AcrR family transcriptional regulator [Halovulum dunhuangense]NNU80721.1 TetR/AcrR family transcriptional regulator [Halovulum dunhuangense]
MRKGQATRERLMDIAEGAIMDKGFGATSIDEIIAAAEITKSGFFYHFPDKNALAFALLERHQQREDELFDRLEARAATLSDDPLHSFLIFITLLAETMDAMETGFPGCLVATFVYQERLFDRNVIVLNRSLVLRWRDRFRGQFERIAERYPPRDTVDLDQLADFVSTVVEGGMVMSRALGERQVLSGQVLVLRSYVKLLFQPALD